MLSRSMSLLIEQSDIWTYCVLEFLGPPELTRYDQGQTCSTKKRRVFGDYLSLLLTCRVIHGYVLKCRSFLFYKFLGVLHIEGKLTTHLPDKIPLVRNWVRTSLALMFGHEKTIPISEWHMRWVDQCASEDYARRFCEMLEHTPWNTCDAINLNNKRLRLLASQLDTIHNALQCDANNKTPRLCDLESIKSLIDFRMDYVRTAYSNGTTIAQKFFKILCNDAEASRYEVKMWSTMILISLGSVSDEAIITSQFPTGFTSYKSLMKEAIHRNPIMLVHASRSLRRSRSLVTEAIKTNCRVFKYADRSLREDKNIVLQACTFDGSLFKYATSSIRSDPDIVEKVLNFSVEAYRHISDNLKIEKKFAIMALRDVRMHPYIPRLLWGERSFVEQALIISGHALRYVPSEMKYELDRMYLLSAVTLNAMALEYVPHDLQDSEIVSTAVKQNGQSIRYAADIHKRSEDTLLEAISSNPLSTFNIVSWLKSNRRMSLEAVRREGNTLGMLSQELRNDREIVLEAVTNNGTALRSASVEFQNDREIVLSALEQSVSALSFVGTSLKRDIQIVKAAVMKSGLALKFAHETVKSSKPIVIAACKNCSQAYKYASPDLKNDFEVLTVASVSFFDLPPHWETLPDGVSDVPYT